MSGWNGICHLSSRSKGVVSRHSQDTAFVGVEQHLPPVLSLKGRSFETVTGHGICQGETASATCPPTPPRVHKVTLTQVRSQCHTNNLIVLESVSGLQTTREFVNMHQGPIVQSPISTNPVSLCQLDKTKRVN